MAHLKKLLTVQSLWRQMVDNEQKISYKESEIKLLGPNLG